MLPKMRLRKDVENDIEKLRQARGRIQTEIDQLQQEEAAVKDQMAEDMLTGNDLKSVQAMADLRHGIEARQEALHAADIKTANLRDELINVVSSENKAIWDKVEREVWMQLAQVSATLANLKMHVSKLKEYDIQNVRPALGFAQDSMVIEGKIINQMYAMETQIFAWQEQIEVLKKLRTVQL